MAQNPWYATSKPEQGQHVKQEPSMPAGMMGVGYPAMGQSQSGMPHGPRASQHGQAGGQHHGGSAQSPGQHGHAPGQQAGYSDELSQALPINKANVPWTPFNPRLSPTSKKWEISRKGADKIPTLQDEKSKP